MWLWNNILSCLGLLDKVFSLLYFILWSIRLCKNCCFYPKSAYYGWKIKKENCPVILSRDFQFLALKDFNVAKCTFVEPFPLEIYHFYVDSDLLDSGVWCGWNSWKCNSSRGSFFHNSEDFDENAAPSHVVSISSFLKRLRLDPKQKLLQTWPILSTHWH